MIIKENYGYKEKMTLDIKIILTALSNDVRLKVSKGIRHKYEMIK